MDDEEEVEDGEDAADEDADEGDIAEGDAVDGGDDKE